MYSETDLYVKKFSLTDPFVTKSIKLGPICGKSSQTNLYVIKSVKLISMC